MSSRRTAHRSDPRGAIAEAHLDTHVLVWLYVDPHRAWPAQVQQLLETGSLRFSPIARLELQYLHDIGRLKVTPAVLLAALFDSLEVRESRQPFGLVVERALGLHWTRDVFDRIIVAEAMAAGAGLISHDATIGKNFDRTVW